MCDQGVGRTGGGEKDGGIGLKRGGGGDSSSFRKMRKRKSGGRKKAPHTIILSNHRPTREGKTRRGRDEERKREGNGSLGPKHKKNEVKNQKKKNPRLRRGKGGK